MNELGIIMLLALAANFIAEWSGRVQKLKEWMFYRTRFRSVEFENFSFKPFDCPMCLGFWIGLAYVLTIPFTTINIFIPFGCAGMAVMVNQLYRKLF